MTPSEVLHRAKEARTKRNLGRTPTIPLPQALRAAPPMPLRAERVIAQADPAHCSAQWSRDRESPVIYGREWPLRDNGRPAWQSLPSGSDTSATPAFAVKYREADDLENDIRFTWEVNRLTWLVPIATHAVRAADPEARDHVIATVEDFLMTDRVGFGARWNSMIELSIQSLSLVLLDSIMSSQSGWSELRPALIDALYQRRRWIRALPSLHSSANNHRLAELAALAVMGFLFGDSAPNDHGESVASFTEECSSQFDGEGFNRELSFDYHTFSFDLMIAVMELSSEAPEPAIAEAAAEIGRTTLRIVDFMGTWPSIGDSDEAALLSTVVAIGDRPAWLAELALEGTDRPAPPSSSVLELESAGYSIARADWGASRAVLVVDHGELGFGAIAAHGHADTAAFMLWIDGDQWLIDSGTFSYHSMTEMRDRLRYSAMHNSITVGGESTSVADGPFLWSPKRSVPRPSISSSASPDGFRIAMRAEVPALKGRRPPSQWHRLVGFSAGHLDIEDEVEVERSSSTVIAQHFILAPGFKPVGSGADPSRVEFTKPGTGSLRFIIPSEADSIAIEEVEVSPRYGRLEATHRLTIGSKPGSRCRLATRIVVKPDRTCEDPNR